jgi:hypothetical protein
MKKAVYKTAAVLVATVIALASAGCTKSPKALAQETVKLEQQAPAPAAAPPAAASAPAQTQASTAPGIVPEAEPNDTERTAQVIKPGDTVSGSFAADDDEDYYKITLASSGKLTAYTEGASDVYILWVEELDEDGDYADSLAEGDYIAGDEGDKRVESDLTAGTYCLYLEGYDAGPYTLKTSFTSGPAPAAAASTRAQTSANWDSLLDQYEEFVDDYIAVMQEVADGDISALTASVSLLEDAESLSERIMEASSDLSAAQSARLLRIQTKLTDAASSLL